ncbi:hypothetical protein Acidovoranil_32120 [Acidovorax sp. FG27]
MEGYGVFSCVIGGMTASTREAESGMDGVGGKAPDYPGRRPAPCGPGYCRATGPPRRAIARRARGERARTMRG